MLRKKRFLIGGTIVFGAIAYLGFVGFQGSATYYYTVSELLAQGEAIHGQNVRVNGQISPENLERESAGQVLKFAIVDIEAGGSLPVIYRGVVPDTFKIGNEVVAEGYLDSGDVFQAHTLMVKCPSKYEAEE